MQGMPHSSKVSRLRIWLSCLLACLQSRVAATVAFMSAFLGQFDLQIQYVSEEIRVHGDLGFDRGTYSQTLTPKSGGQGNRESGKYLWIYSRQSDGGWEFSRVMWNASESPS